MSIWTGFASAFQAGWNMVDGFLEKAEERRKEGEYDAGLAAAQEMAEQGWQERRSQWGDDPGGDVRTGPAGEATRTADEERGAPTARQASTADEDALRRGIIESANTLGIDPVDLATTISYETGGTFDPLKRGPTTQWGQHRGLIQFGEPQARENGVDWNDPLRSQLGERGAVVNYLRRAGVKPGMGLLDVYSAVNAGAPGLYDRTDENNGGAPGTVRDKVERQMGPHRDRALRLLAPALRPRTAAVQLDQEQTEQDDPMSAVPVLFASSGGAVPKTWEAQAPDARGSVFLRHAGTRPTTAVPAPAPSPAPSPAPAPSQDGKRGWAERFRETRQNATSHYQAYQAKYAEVQAQLAAQQKLIEQLQGRSGGAPAPASPPAAVDNSYGGPNSFSGGNAGGGGDWSRDVASSGSGIGGALGDATGWW